MVLRMEMRWAERRGFGVELLEASPGEEAGIKSATFRVSGENAYGLYGSEKGVHRLVRLSPFDSAHRRQTSFAGVEVSPVVEEAGRGRDRRGRPADRHLPRQRRRRPARQQDRLGGPHHPPADGHRRAVPERALAVLEQGHRDGDAPLEARRAPGAPAARGDRQRARRGSGRQLRLADPLLRPASLHDGQGPPHRPRDGRRRPSARRRPRRVRPRLPAHAAASSTGRVRRHDPSPAVPADGAVPRGDHRLRLPRLRPASTCPATRAAREPILACAPRSATARCCSTSRRTSRGSTSGPRRRPYERAEALAADGLRRRAHLVPHQRRHPGQSRPLPGPRPARDARWCSSATRTPA